MTKKTQEKYVYLVLLTAYYPSQCTGFSEQDTVIAVLSEYPKDIGAVAKFLPNLLDKDMATAIDQLDKLVKKGSLDINRGYENYTVRIEKVPMNAPFDIGDLS